MKSPLSPPACRPIALAALLLLAGAAGCNSSLTMKVVDIDDAYKPVAGTTVSRFKTPRRPADPWPTTPIEVKQTDATGTVVFDDNRGRFVIEAPGKPRASFYSSFAPSKMEIGVGDAKP